MAPTPPWSDLPIELLSTIADSLKSNPIDILSFRSVCKSWHFSSLTISSKSSSLINPSLPLTSRSPPYTLRSRYSSSNQWAVLSATVIYSLKPPEKNPLFSPANWVVFLGELNSRKVILRKPFANQSYWMPINFPESINLLELHGCELGRFYNLTVVAKPSVKVTKPNVWCSEATKVVVLSNMTAALLLSEEGKVGLLRLGVGEMGVMNGCPYSKQEWEVLHEGKKFRFDDIVEFKGRVLGVDRRGKVYEIDLSSKVVSLIANPIAGGGGRRKRLVESLGKLYLVVRCLVVETKAGVSSPAFRVYEFKFPDVQKKKWFEVCGIGDRIFFFGVNFSFSTSTEQLGGCCKGNCVVYQAHSFRNYDGGDDDHSMFYALPKKDLCVGVCHLDDAVHVGLFGSYAGYSELLWPPPSWIWQIDRTMRLGEVETAIDEILSKIPENLKAKFEELLIAGDSSTLKDLKHPEQEILGYFNEANKLKTLSIQMKEQDRYFIPMEESRRDFIATCTDFVNQVQAPETSAEVKDRCADLIQRAEQHRKEYTTSEDPLNLKERISVFSGLILNLEESFGKFVSLHETFTLEGLLKR